MRSVGGEAAQVRCNECPHIQLSKDGFLERLLFDRPDVDTGHLQFDRDKDCLVSLTLRDHGEGRVNCSRPVRLVPRGGETNGNQDRRG